MPDASKARQSPGSFLDGRTWTILINASIVSFRGGRQPRDQLGTNKLAMEDTTAEQRHAIRGIYDSIEQSMARGKPNWASIETAIKAFPGAIPTQKRLITTLRNALERAKASKNPLKVLDEVLPVIGSWGDTLSQKVVHEYLRSIAACGSIVVERFASNRPQPLAFG
jgi:hypothetical protein